MQKLAQGDALQEGEGDGEARVKGASVMSGAVGFVGAIAVDKSGG